MRIDGYRRKVLAVSLLVCIAAGIVGCWPGRRKDLRAASREAEKYYRTARCKSGDGKVSCACGNRCVSTPTDCSCQDKD
jgi:hypothetical protein